MEKPISRILLVTGDSNERRPVVRALARSGAKVIDAHNAAQALWLMENNPSELPELVIMFLHYYEEEDPLKLYKELRKSRSTEAIPVLILVTSELERVMVETLHLVNCCGSIAPLTYASLVFALPALNIQIRDSILYHKPKRPSWQNSIGFLSSHPGDRQLGSET
jgi:CheY-like chemotaxis protein